MSIGSWNFHDDVGRLHDRDREIDPARAREVVGGLGRHERHDAMGAGLDVHDRDEAFF